MTDPREPGWRAEYDPGADPGDIGSGVRLGAHLYHLFRAGRNELPTVAAVYSDLTSRVHGVTGDLNALFDVPGHGMEPAQQQLLELRDELHDVLRRTCLRLQEVGEALVTVATEYVVADEVAVDEFNRLLDRVEDLDNHDDDPEARAWDRQPPFVPEPPPVDAPPPPPRHDDGHVTGDDPQAGDEA